MPTENKPAEPVTLAEELDAVLHWRGKHAQTTRERDALQQRLNAADERLDQAVTALNEIARVSRMGEKSFEIATLAIGEISAMVEQPASVAVVLPERSPKDYAIEHAEFMATSADDVLAKFQAYGLTLLAVDEGGDDGEGELFESIDSARGDLQESLVELRGMVYEFRKRSTRLNTNPDRSTSVLHPQSL